MWKFDLGLIARKLLFGMLAALAGFSQPTNVFASDFSEPWTREDRALVVDAYEYNEINWQELVGDKRIVGFINKASDGLPPAYFCTGNETEYRLCKALWHRHAVARELFQTRRTLAKALGLKWGAYHLARPGNPLEQAENFLDFAEPGPDDVIALDIEDNDPSKWMSLEDAEIFVREINRRTGRFPILYTNGSTAKHIADNGFRYRLLSRLPLWYARYKPEIGMHFPKGNWDDYALWQFASQTNCNARACPYRVKGTNNDIDVNVASMSPDELRHEWPFGGLVDQKMELVASVPVPYPREKALTGDVEIVWAAVGSPAPTMQERIRTWAQDGMTHLASAYTQASVSAGQTAIAAFLDTGNHQSLPANVDPVTTASVTKSAHPTLGPSPTPVFPLRPLQSGEAFQELFGFPAENPDRSETGRTRDSEIDALLLAAFLTER